MTDMCRQWTPALGVAHGSATWAAGPRGAVHQSPASATRPSQQMAPLLAPALPQPLICHMADMAKCRCRPGTVQSDVPGPAVHTVHSRWRRQVPRALCIRHRLTPLRRQLSLVLEGLCPVEGKHVLVLPIIPEAAVEDGPGPLPVQRLANVPEQFTEMRRVGYQHTAGEGQRQGAAVALLC